MTALIITGLDKLGLEEHKKEKIKRMCDVMTERVQERNLGIKEVRVVLEKISKEKGLRELYNTSVIVVSEEKRYYAKRVGSVLSKELLKTFRTINKRAELQREKRRKREEYVQRKV